MGPWDGEGLSPVPPGGRACCVVCLVTAVSHSGEAYLRSRGWRGAGPTWRCSGYSWRCRGSNPVGHKQGGCPLCCPVSPAPCLLGPPHCAVLGSYQLLPVSGPWAHWTPSLARDCSVRTGDGELVVNCTFMCLRPQPCGDFKPSPQRTADSLGYLSCHSVKL